MHRTASPRPAQGTTAIPAEAGLAKARLAVAKAVLQAEFCREGATAEAAAAKAEEAVETMATGLAFGRLPMPLSAGHKGR